MITGGSWEGEGGRREGGRRGGREGRREEGREGWRKRNEGHKIHRVRAIPPGDDPRS